MTDEHALSPDEQAHKIQSLRDMINSAEKTIQGARSMLLQLEGKKKAGRKRKVDDSDGEVIEGVFDGQIMIGSNGKQYPVPANYASKSKLVQGDVMKLTITSDGSFIYKQIGPVSRRHAIGIISQDERGNHHVVADGKIYKVLLASITYFRAEPGDEVAIILSQDTDTEWTVIDSVLASAHSPHNPQSAPHPAILAKTRQVQQSVAEPVVEIVESVESDKSSKAIEDLVKQNAQKVAEKAAAQEPSPLLPPTQFFTQQESVSDEIDKSSKSTKIAATTNPWSTEILNIEDELQKEVA